jgi:hypothetical protein
MAQWQINIKRSRVTSSLGNLDKKKLSFTGVGNTVPHIVVYRKCTLCM